MSEKIRSNPYLTGNFAPLHSEDDFDLEVVGEIPAGLEGALYRTGPNPQFQPLDPNYHWFTGDGMVHAFRIGGGAEPGTEIGDVGVGKNPGHSSIHLAVPRDDALAPASRKVQHFTS